LKRGAPALALLVYRAHSDPQRFRDLAPRVSARYLPENVPLTLGELGCARARTTATEFPESMMQSRYTLFFCSTAWGINFAQIK